MDKLPKNIHFTTITLQNWNELATTIIWFTFPKPLLKSPIKSHKYSTEHKTFKLKLKIKKYYRCCINAMVRSNKGFVMTVTQTEKKSTK